MFLNESELIRDLNLTQNPASTPRKTQPQKRNSILSKKPLASRLSNPDSTQLTERSFWEQQAFLSGYDVAIIGGGLVGLTAAIHLARKKPRWKIIVIERGTLPSGASTRNAGFACFGSPTELVEDIANQGWDQTLALVERRYRGLNRLRELVGDQGLQYEPCGGYELFTLDDDPSQWEAALEILPRLNAELGSILGQDQPFQIADERIPSLGMKRLLHLIHLPAEGVLHPGHMVRTLQDLAREEGVRFFNGLEVKDIEATGSRKTLHFTNGWKLGSERVVVATNGFARRLLPELQVTPARNQVLLTQPVKFPWRGCFHHNRGYIYFRHVGDRVLLGGFRNLDPEGETTEAFGHSPEIRFAQERYLSDVILPGEEWEIDMRWSGILGLGAQKTPIIREVQPGLFVAVRLGGMGVAIGCLVGEEVGECVGR